MGDVTVFDRHTDDGHLMTRGYLELALDEQFCEGASEPEDDGTSYLSLTLYVLSPKTGEYIEAKTFATHIPTTIDVDTRKNLLVLFMDNLTEKHRVSVFMDASDINDDTLENFRSEVEYATPSWVEAA